MKPETKFQNQVVLRLKAIPNLWYTKVSQRSIRGVPDIIGCYNGRFFAWELKVPPNRLKKESLQYHIVQRIKETGGLAREVTPATLQESIEELLCLKDL